MSSHCRIEEQPYSEMALARSEYFAMPKHLFAATPEQLLGVYEKLQQSRLPSDLAITAWCLLEAAPQMVRSGSAPLDIDTALHMVDESEDRLLQGERAASAAPEVIRPIERCRIRLYLDFLPVVRDLTVGEVTDHSLDEAYVAAQRSLRGLLRTYRGRRPVSPRLISRKDAELRGLISEYQVLMTGAKYARPHESDHATLLLLPAGPRADNGRVNRRDSHDITALLTSPDRLDDGTYQTGIRHIGGLQVKTNHESRTVVYDSYAVPTLYLTHMIDRRSGRERKFNDELLNHPRTKYAPMTENAYDNIVRSLGRGSSGFGV